MSFLLANASICFQDNIYKTFNYQLGVFIVIYLVIFLFTLTKIEILLYIICRILAQQKTLPYKLEMIMFISKRSEIF